MKSRKYFDTGRFVTQWPVFNIKSLMGFQACDLYSDQLLIGENLNLLY